MDFRRFHRPLRLALATALAAATALSAADSPPPAGVGATVETLTCKGVVYHAVKVRAINRNGLMLQHSGGLMSVPWGDLPQSWRTALASQIQTEQPKGVIVAKPTPTPAVKPVLTPAQISRVAVLFALIGEPVKPQNGVDLRPRMRDFALWIKQQGAEPSCSVHAILSALEYQYAEAKGTPCRFDTQELLLATESVTRRRRFAQADDPSADAGFTLPEVVLAIRKHGLKVSEEFLREQLQKDPQAAMEAPVSPNVVLHMLPGGDRTQEIANLVHALDTGLPVPIGIAFPTRRAAQNGFLSTQPPAPGSAHAVTLVGYECPSGRLEDTVFIFRNSWGVSWGAGGYGRASFDYLKANLLCAVVLEVL